MKERIKQLIRRYLLKVFPELRAIERENFSHVVDVVVSDDSFISPKAKVCDPASIEQSSSIGDYSYMAINGHLRMVAIGKFCSIGPNLLAGYGIHPTDGVSTSPMFYSTICQNGTTLSQENKIIEQKPITIGNDVFIGANVTILDGVTIGDGAIIGAGAVVSKDIPPYAIAVGSPIRIIRYRFPDDTIAKLLDLKWWNLPDEKLHLVERYFWDVDKLLIECEIQCQNFQS